jgi:hypothetical protein
MVRCRMKLFLINRTDKSKINVFLYGVLYRILKEQISFTWLITCHFEAAQKFHVKSKQYGNNFSLLTAVISTF